MRVQSSHLAKSKRTDRAIFRSTRRAILSVILLATLAVILAVLLHSLSSPERVVKQKISEIAADYYENYFYPQLTANLADNSSLSIAMERYETPGFNQITLRQLLLFDNEHYAKSGSILSTYCDENDTTMRIFPISPYRPTDYRIEYHYACEF